MDPVEIAQGVDARPECSLTPTDPVSKVLNDDDLVIEILLRLTPKPSSLRNVSLVYKRWRRILFDPQFLGRFRKHHWKLLGFFYQQFNEAPNFTPISDQLDLIAAALPENLFHPYSGGGVFLGCCDGIALVLHRARHEAIIWEPTTGGKNHLAFPPAVSDGFETSVMSAAVMCSARDIHQHLHNENCLSTFKLVLVCQEDFANQKKKCVQLDELFSRPARRKNVILLAGYDEDTNAIFLSSDSHDFILQLESVQFRYIGRRECTHFRMYYPYTNFYIAAVGKRGEGAATDRMEPVEIPQGVDARPECSLTPTDSVSKVLSDDDLLIEILLRLTPKPSSLRNTSLIYKRWRRILFDPQFLGRFRKHHWKLLGFFYQQFNEAPIFTPISDQLDLIAAALPENLSDPYSLGGVFLGCRNGITLVLDCARHKAIIWEPTTGGKNHVAFPPAVSHGFETSVVSAAVMCSARDVHQHLHNENCLSTFELVLVCQEDFANQTKVSVCLYDSKSNTWGDIISMTDTCKIANAARPSVMVGNALYWLLSGANILEFDFERQTLVVIEKPTTYAHVTGSSVDMSFQILRGEDNCLGLAVLSKLKLSIELWGRKSNGDGIVSWVLQKCVQLDELFSKPARRKNVILLAGYDEDTNAIFLSSDSHDFILQLESAQFRYIGRRECT
uniref:F-box domain-containing protein n=1 Tax=Triticum urartu TaxID=4572 RepID=A0A8R7UMT4_TRIUA